jgi:2-amino-4-hydroxy-6-hydroxymethyldihydropteridine diphosphokinase
VSESACVALGSNLGERESHVAAALVALTRHPDVTSLVVSSLWETAPVGGPPGQGPYLNAAVCFETTLPPRALLDLLLEIERCEGRERGEPDAPRTLDLDLLFYGVEVIQEEGLTVPHPRLHERAFVLAPLREIAPTWVHPEFDASVEALAERLEAESGWASAGVTRCEPPKAGR